MFTSLIEFWALTRRFKRQLAIVCTLLCVDGVLTAFSVVTVAPLADLVLERPQSEWIPVTVKLQQFFENISIPFNLVSMTLLFFGLTLSIALFSVIVKRSLVRLQITVMRNLIEESLETMFAADWRYFSSTQRGVLNNTYIGEIRKTATSFQGLAQGIALIVKILSFLIVPLIIQPIVVSICLVATMIMVIPFMYLGKWSFLFGVNNLKFGNVYASLLRESIEAAREVISYGKERETTKQISKAFQRSGDAQVKAATFNAFATQMYEPIGILIIITTLLVARQTLDSLAISSMAVVLWGLIRTIAPIKNLIQIKHNIDNKLPSLRQVLHELNRAEGFRQSRGTKFTEQKPRTVVFDDVHFAYQDNARGLAGCSFHAGENQLVALVGESGSGKSTIIDMILGLQRPSSGTVLMNGMDSREIDLSRWREGLSLVPQKPVLFDLSIRDNLLWAERDASDEEIWRVCEIVNAARFIEQLPYGLDTEIGDSGMRLSGGQLQRIALARAIIRKPDLLILDEATSALDTETEAMIYNSLSREIKDSLVFIVAHRLSTIANADKILVFQQGKLIEQGKYQELISQNGYFKRLVESQPGMQSGPATARAVANE